MDEPLRVFALLICSHASCPSPSITSSRKPFVTSVSIHIYVNAHLRASAAEEALNN